ncbi:hypothetical protein BDZ45DRAFT_692718 [Acephala macrosclerotiorum]|nr:hypothetical protein BDZ45DRAFT_692718 [Acephala macrosclerotiorum]
MDPLSIATTVTALATLSSQVVILCNNLARRYQTMRRTLIVLRTEISTYQTALHPEQDLLLDLTSSLATYLGCKNEWTDSFDTALSACSITTSILIGELEKAVDAASGGFITYTLKEDDIKDLTNGLQGRQGGVQLLVQTLQLQSTTDIVQLLHKNQDILKKVQKQTDRLSTIRGMHSNAETNETFSIFNLDIEDKRFGFDDELSRFRPIQESSSGTASTEDEATCDKNTNLESTSR